MRYNLLLCGVGGQGIITLSEIVASAALSKDIKTIVTQEKGLAQRGGSVKAHIRLGDVYSPTMPNRSAHGVLSLELNETFGYFDFMNKDTVSVVSETVIPSGGGSGKGKKDTEDQGEPDSGRAGLERKLGKNLQIVDSTKMVREIGVPRGGNVFMLGVLFGKDPRLTEMIGPDDLVKSIRAILKREVEQNITVFEKGIEYGRSGQ